MIDLSKIEKDVDVTVSNFIQQNAGDVVMLSIHEYDRLSKDSEWLGYLEAGGVDNWSGIEFAYELKREDDRKKGIQE